MESKEEDVRTWPQIPDPLKEYYFHTLSMFRSFPFGGYEFKNAQRQYV